MIRYSLKCADGHVFESWFRDSAAFDALAKAGQVACAVCGDLRVAKAIMAPAVAAARASAADVPSPPKPNAPAPAAPAPMPMLSAPASPVERALSELRRHLSENADYVGRRFAEEARRIHVGEADERAIWGEATAEDAQALRDEGVPVAPLPFLSRRDD